MRELFVGLALGLSAGVAPGPLLTLVVVRTLRRGFPAGLRVALAPLVTDAAVIALALTLLDALPAAAVTGLGVAGGAYVVLLGAVTVRGARAAELPGPADESGSSRDLLHGVVVNLLNPHPWLFWLAVGGPILLDAWDRTPARAVAFVVPFYALLVGSKIALARGIAAGRRHLTARAYRAVLAASGLLLVGVGAFVIWEAAG